MIVTWALQKNSPIWELGKKRAEREVTTLLEKVENITRTDGKTVSEDLHDDLVTIMNGHNEEVKQSFPEGSRRLFWDQQLKTSSLKSTAMAPPHN